MDRMIYLAMSGAKQTMMAQTINAQNLANISTTGFRADLAAFRSLPVNGPGYPSRVYAIAEDEGVDFGKGRLMTTGNELDMAVRGNGWIVVQGTDGREGLTRAGNMKITETGNLVTGTNENQVMGDGGPIVIPPSEKVEIGEDGTVTVLPVGQSASTLAVVGRIKLVNPPSQELEKGPDGLMRLQSGDTAVSDVKVRLVSGTLESSNVNAMDAMINMITLQRAFEANIKMMSAAKDNDEATATMMRIN